MWTESRPRNTNSIETVELRGSNINLSAKLHNECLLGHFSRVFEKLKWLFMH